MSFINTVNEIENKMDHFEVENDVFQIYYSIHVAYSMRLNDV